MGNFKDRVEKTLRSFKPVFAPSIAGNPNVHYPKLNPCILLKLKVMTLQRI